MQPLKFGNGYVISPSAEHPFLYTDTLLITNVIWGYGALHCMNEL